MTQVRSKSSPQLGAYVEIQDCVILDPGLVGTICIGTRSKLKTGTVLKAMDGRIELGSRVTIGEYCYLAGHGGLVIGDNSIVAPHCCISAANHIFDDVNVPIRFQGEMALGICIGSDVWIGARTVILDGISIGTGCVIGAGSVVTKSLPDYAIAIGSPCEVVRWRGRDVFNISEG